MENIKNVPTASHNFSFFSSVAVKMRFAAPKTTFLGFYPVFFSNDFVVCRLWQNSSKYPTLPGFLMSSVYVDLAFQHSACFSFTFDVVMHRSTFSPASVFECVCVQQRA